MTPQLGDTFTYHGAGLRGRVFTVTNILPSGAVVGEVLDNPNSASSIAGMFEPAGSGFEWVKLGGQPVGQESELTESIDAGWTPADANADLDEGWTFV